MISVNRVLDELQTQLLKAKAAQDESAVREAVAAMQSLCGLVLDEGRTSGLPAAEMPVAPEPPSMPASQPLEGRRLEEDDANGGSLFDF